MDRPTKNTLALLALVIGIATGAINLLKDGPSVVAQYRELFFFASGVAFLVAATAQRAHFFRWIHTRPIATGALTAATIIVAPTAAARGVFDAQPHTALQVATFAGTVAVVAVTLLTVESYRRGTRYNGLFPDNLVDIIELLDTAQVSIKILTDFVAYGAFSAPKLHEKLVRTLIRKRREHDVEVSWRAYDDESAARFVAEQLQLTGLQPDTPAEKAFLESEPLRTFCDTFQGFELPDSIDDFMNNILLKRNRDVANELVNAGASVSTTMSQSIPIYLWIVDNKRAVFSFSCKGSDGVREDTFATDDHGLIAMLLDIYDSRSNG